MLGIRWTIGDVTGAGFEALGLSIEGARRVFAPDTRLAELFVREHWLALRDTVATRLMGATWAGESSEELARGSRRKSR